MRTKQTLKFNIDDLPQKPKDILRQGYQVNDNEHHLWCDLNAILDGIGLGDFEGVKPPQEVSEPLTVGDVPKSWWKLMSFSPAMARKMKKFWSENPSGEIEWTWD